MQIKQDEKAHKKLKDFILSAFDSLNSNYHASSSGVEEERKVA